MSDNNKKRVFSGIQPSGELHLGNWLSVIKIWVDSQDKYDNIFCVVDLHALTVPQPPRELAERIRQLTALYLACGLDPKKSVIFVQSSVPAHTELAWILDCLTPLGWLKRMTQFKDKSAGDQNKVSAGLLNYPVLMAADILLYQTDLVPVGDDQIQHVELCRDIAKSFNGRFGRTFVVPEVLTRKNGARIMSLSNPLNKMSKSAEDAAGRIGLRDKPPIIHQKIRRAVTDSGREIKFDQQRPGLNNLLTIYQILSHQTPEKIEREFTNKGYGQLKDHLADLVITELQPIQKKYDKIIADRAGLDQMLRAGARRAAPLAEKTLSEVKSRMGIGLSNYKNS